MCVLLLLASSLVQVSLAQDFWDMARPNDMASITSLEVMCGKTYMEVQVGFNKPFNGIIFSKGAVDQYNCIYVKPQTGSSQYTFNIFYDQCGTKPDMNGKFYENNIVIQYDKDLIEVWDEAKRLRCEWYNDYEKGITKPPIRVSDLEVVELNFRGDNVDCWMEIQHGKGPWASVVNGIVPLGTTLTMVVGIKDKLGEFDMRVKSCSAEAENSEVIYLTDENGCVLRPKMISRFMKIAGSGTRADVMTYAFFHAFKFPDSMSVQIKCKVEICRFGCPEHCDASAQQYQQRSEQDISASINIPSPSYRGREDNAPRYLRRTQTNITPAISPIENPQVERKTGKAMENVQNPRINIGGNNGPASLFGILPLPKLPNLFSKNSRNNEPPQNEQPPPPNSQVRSNNVPLHRTVSKSPNHLVDHQFARDISPSLSDIGAADIEEGFPHGPRDLSRHKRTADLDAGEEQYLSRSRRAVEEMGVHFGFQVLSQQDLAFRLENEDESQAGVMVFQGKIKPEEVIYGVCLSASKLSVIFVLLSILAVASVLISIFYCYRKFFNTKQVR